MLSLWFTIAIAEPPEFIPLETVIHDADLVIVGTPQRVYFEDLKSGQFLKSHSHAGYWMEYRIDEVLYGTAPVKPGETVRITFDPGACEMYDFTIKREGDRFTETVGTQTRELDPKVWRPDEKRLLALTIVNGAVRHDGFWVSPAKAEPKARAEWERLVASRSDSR